MDRFIPIAVIVTILVLGFISVKRKQYNLLQKLSFANTFLEKLDVLWRDRQNRGEIYTWLVLNSEKMQSQTGRAGISAQYRPPYANYMISNYYIIINTIHELRSWLDDSLGIKYTEMIQNTILRHNGVLMNELEQLETQLRNPLVWFRNGVRFILSLPFYLLREFGLLGSGTSAHILASRSFNFLASIVALIGFISAIVGLVIGWDDFIKKISDLLN